jgi:hypothetical protein
MGRMTAFAAGVGGVLLSVPAHTQGVQLQMSDNNLSRFCFWNSRIFSVGSFFCVEKNKMLQCNIGAPGDKQEDRAIWEMRDHTACAKADVPK